MTRRFHLPALGAVAGQVVGVAAAIVAAPELAHSRLGKAALVVHSLATLWQAVTKPIQGKRER